MSISNNSTINDDETFCKKGDCAAVDGGAACRAEYGDGFGCSLSGKDW